MHHVTRRLVALVATLLGGLAILAPTPTQAADPCATGHWPARGAANTTATANPLDDGPWGVGGPKWRSDEWQAYCGATATQQAQLVKINSRPRMMWFGYWYSTSDIASQVHAYIANEQNGDPQVIAQLAVFRIFAGGEGARHTKLTSAQVTDYKSWITKLISGIGSARVAIMMEPDLGLAAYDSADPGTRLGLVKWAAGQFHAHPNIATYLEASSADWLSVPQAVAMLEKAGIQYTRGFALGATHYSKLSNEIVYAQKVSDALASAGYPGRKAIIDTSDNGRGFSFQQFYATYGSRTDFGTNSTCKNSPTTSQCGTWFDDAYVCTATRTSTCVTLGVPPTWHVASSGMSSTMQSLARTYVDGYTWFGRSWLYAQATPYKLPRAMAMAQTTPYQ